jgi:hypothetical protein
VAPGLSLANDTVKDEDTYLAAAQYESSRTVSILASSMTAAASAAALAASAASAQDPLPQFNIIMPTHFAENSAWTQGVRRNSIVIDSLNIACEPGIGGDGTTRGSGKYRCSSKGI